MVKRFQSAIALLLTASMLLPNAATLAQAADSPTAVEAQDRTCEHAGSYVLQDDSYEATDTKGGYRHYKCAECDAEYAYETDPMVYEVNPKTGEAVTLDQAANPYLPNWEFMPDNELHVFWSKEDDEWRVYAVGSHDTALTGWCGDDITCWSAPVYDLSDWRFEAILRDTGRFFACDFNYDLQTDQAVLYAFPFFGNEEMSGTHLWVNGHSVPDAYFDTPLTEGEGVVGLDGVNLFDPSLYIAEDGTMLATYDDSTGGTKHAQLAKVNANDRTKVEWKVDVKMAEGEKNTNGFNPKHYEGSTIDLVEVDGHSYWVIQYSYKSNWDDETDYEKDVDGEKRWWPLVYIYSDPDMEIDELKDFEGWHYGGIIGDNGGFYRQNVETGEVEDHDDPVTNWGNNHGGLVYINGQWYVSNHRHTSTGAGRQGYIRTVDVSLDGEKLVISTPEYTSSIGDSIDAYQTWPAYIACHLWPASFSETGEQISYIDNPLRYAQEQFGEDYVAEYWSMIYDNPEYAEHLSPIVGIEDGVEVGFKYLDFGSSARTVDLSVLVAREDGYVDGTMEVYLDAPSVAEGGTKIGAIEITDQAMAAAGVDATGVDGTEWSKLTASMDTMVSGTHGVFFVFSSEEEGTICKLDAFTFTPETSGGGSSGSVSTASYTITVTQSEGGTITPGTSSVARGSDKTFTIKADDGFVITDVLVDGKSVGAVSSYTFEDVKARHTITAKFEKTGTIGTFTDVKTGDWFADAVQYVVDNGLMNGVAADRFAPQSETTRAMIVTILYREAGSPAVESSGETWWSDARVWAMGEGVSDGTDMESAITREQLAAMLYRYAGSPAVSGEITGFSDTAQISDWASDAMLWAVNSGIMSGSSGRLNPQNHASRAEVAAMLMRFCELSK